jgi:sulfonate transport system permease protein
MSTQSEHAAVSGERASPVAARVATNEQPVPTPAPPSAARTLPPAAAWLLPTAVLLLWESVVRVGILPAHWMPAPSTVLTTLAQLARAGVLVDHVLATLLRVAAGFALGALVATVLGVLTGRSPAVRVLLDPSLQALRNIPSLAWVPLFLLWFGIQEASKIALIAVGVFFPVYLNLMAGILAIDPKLIEVGVMYRYHGWGLARRVLLPATLPFYLTGLRSGLSLGWMFVVAAELMGASRGLGYLMVDGQSTSRPELILAALVLFALFGKLSDYGLERLSKRAQRWRTA